MIASIFSKSKPINFILVSLVVLLVFLLTNHEVLLNNLQLTLGSSSRLILTLFMIFLLDFVIAKNKLSQGNSYGIMTFGLLIVMFPETMKFLDILLANLFILFALRRLVSLHSNLHMKKKLFDAGFWIAIATLCYFWAFLFFALVIVALIYYSQNDLRNILVPVIGAATAFVILVAYNILIYNTYLRPSNFERYASLDFTLYNSKDTIIKLTVLVTTFVWSIVYYFRTLQHKNKKLRPSYFLIAWASILAILIAIIAPVKNGSEFLFLMAPLSLIIANYIESISERWFRELFVSLFLLAPVLSLLL